jgi:hypothetical protein
LLVKIIALLLLAKYQVLLRVQSSMLQALFLNVG